MSAGLPFDNTTYEELMSTVDIAQVGVERLTCAQRLWWG